ncbi:MAG: hypothetical protein PVG48_00560 [Candidatus Bathyarchaeota archaeon]
MFCRKVSWICGFAPSLSWTQFNVWVCMFVSVTGGQPFIQRRDAFCVWVDAAVELRLAIHVAKTGLTCLRQYKGCEELLINLMRRV